jgi:hypothetical protein
MMMWGRGTYSKNWSIVKTRPFEIFIHTKPRHNHKVRKIPKQKVGLSIILNLKSLVSKIRFFDPHLSRLEFNEGLVKKFKWINNVHPRLYFVLLTCVPWTSFEFSNLKTEKPQIGTQK